MPATAGRARPVTNEVADAGMLFNSHIFLFAFLPAVLLLFRLTAAIGPRSTIGGLVVASLFFYGWWNPSFVPLLIGSILFNHAVGFGLATLSDRPLRRWLFGFGVAVDLGILATFKYLGFFVSTMGAATGMTWAPPDLVLPLGISFYSFTQIAFLADTYRREVGRTGFLSYGLFVTYFPHLIAGPVLHHAEMMPQFARIGTARLSGANVSVGLTIFVIGLFKKVVIADSLSPYAGMVFDGHGELPTFLDGWIGALAYTAQIYFDFSGYSDMAIGLSKMFGILLPLNFASPYKSRNIVEFWRRWHMTLSRFLRDYLYIPLGGNRRGPARRHVNLFLTMLLGGLWHGAGWTFVLWGALHGLYLIANHGWRALARRAGLTRTPGATVRFGCWALTFLAVVAAWVPFRAPTLRGAVDILESMAGLNGVILPGRWAELMGPQLAGALRSLSIDFGRVPHLTTTPLPMALLAGAFAVAFFLPNTQQVMRRFSPALGVSAADGTGASRLDWSPTAGWAALVAVLAGMAGLRLTDISEFLYFQF